jgi:hypothetical protein
MAKRVRKMLQKGVAIATMVGAAVALMQVLKKNKKAKMVEKAADEAKRHVIAHAKKLGGVSKKSYFKIVDSVLSEYKNMKTMTKEEVDELGDELKDKWSDTAKMLKK